MHMGKRFCGNVSLLASLLLLFQLVFPMVNALAAEDPAAPASTVETPAPAGTSTTPETTTSPETPANPGTTTPTEPQTPPTDPQTPPTDPQTPPTDPQTPPTDPQTPPTDPQTPPTDPQTPPTDPQTPPTDPQTPPAPPAPAPKSLVNMLPPSNLAFQLLTPDDVKLTWSSVFGATGYNVYGIYDGEMKLLGTTPSTTFTFNDAPEGSHQFVVSTQSTDGESGPCAPVQVDIVYPKMQAPTTVTAKIQNGNDIVLTWTASQYAGTYNLYQIAADGTQTLVTKATGLTYTITNAADGSFTYAISSTNSLYGESPVSTPVTIDVAHPTMAAPGHFSNTVANGNDLNFKWDAVPFANSYKVYQVIDGQKVLQKTVSGTTLTLANLTAGDYSYVVHSFSDRYGESEQGSELSLTLVHPTMAAPANFKYTTANVNDITLTWSAATYATGYKVYQIIDGQKVLQKTVTSTSVAFPALQDGDYIYEVYSYSDRFGESATGSQVKLTVDIPTMQAPGNFAYKVQNGNDIVLTWAAAANANNYKVYQVIGDQKVLKSTATGLIATLANMPAGDYTYEVHSVSTRYGESAEGSQVTFNLTLPTMQAPGNLTQSIANGNDITLKWDATPYANNYKVYQIVNGQKVLKSTVTTTTVTYANMAAGEYSYEVHAVSSRFGESLEGSQVTVPLVFPTIVPPANLKQTITNATDFTLSWDASPYAGSYKVYQVVNGQKTLVKTVTGTSVAFTNMNAGDYSYVVHTVSARFGESAEGSELTVTLNGVTMQAPVNLTQTIANGNDIILKWDAVPYANSYKVYQIIDGQPPVLKSTVTTTTATYTNMAAGDYKYEVRSFSTRYGESANAASVSFSVVYPTVVAPGNLTSKVQNGNDVVLTWTAGSNANSYKVYEQVDGQKVLKQTVTTLTSTVSNAAAGDHTYVVNAVNTRFGESAQGAELTLTITFPTMQAPGTLTQTIVNVNDITLKWGAAQYATNYKVYQIIDGQKVLQKTVTGAITTTFVNMPAGDYTYEVHSNSDRFGESPEGSQVTFSLGHPTMQAPGNLTQTIANGNDIALKWSVAQYATAYKVYQIVDGQKVLKTTQTGSTVTYVNMLAGDYTYELHSFSDRFGESAEGSQVSLSLVHPTMQAPGTLTQTIANGNDIVLKWGTAQYATNYRLYQIKDGQKVLLKTQTASTITYPNMPAGDYSYVVYSYSDRFGESPEGSPLTFSLVHPTMQAPGTLTQSIVNGNDVVLKWGTAQFATNYRVYQIIDGQKVLKNTLTGSTVTFVNMPAGDTSYAVHSFSNRFGESPDASTVNFTLVHPVVQPPVLKDTITNVNNITLTWNAVQWANEYRVYKVNGDVKDLVYKGTALTFPVYNLSQDTHTYEVTAFSTRFGESATSNQISEKIVYPKMQTPTATAKVLGPNSARVSWNFVTYANGYNVYEIVDGQPVLLVKNLNALSYTLNNLSYKNHTYYVTSYSNSFGESDPSDTVLAKLIIDETAPVTTANAPTAWTNTSPITVTLSATDNDTGVAKTFYSLNGSDFAEGTSIKVSDEGINKLSFYSVDKVDNKEAIKTVELKIDQTAPVTQASEVATWSNDVVAFSLNATDKDSGVAKTYYSIDGSDYVEGSSLLVDKEGVNQVSFYSIDQAGNQEQPQAMEVKVDKTAPVTTANAPTNWSQADVNVTLTATDAQSGVAKTFYSINGSDYAEGTSFTVDQEGVNKITFYSVDQAGNKEQTQTVEVQLDRTAPVTASNAPTAWAKDDVTVTLASTDEQSGVAKTYYSVNGSDYAEGTTFTVDKEGVNNITFYSVDQTGNKEQAQTIEVKLDKKAPVTASNAPTLWSKDDVTVTLTSNDEQSGIAKTFYSIDGSDYAEGTSFTVNQEGIHKITFYSMDVAGNTEPAQTAEVKMDKTAPVLTMNLNADYKLSSLIQLAYTASDAQSGVATEKMTVSGPDGEQVLTNGATLTANKPGTYTVTVTATDVVGLTTTLQKQFVVNINATIDVMPKDIKCDFGYFAIRVRLEKGYSTRGFDLSSVRLNGVQPISNHLGFQMMAKVGVFIFKRSDFNLPPNSEVKLEFNGTTSGSPVYGETIWKVLK